MTTKQIDERVDELLRTGKHTLGEAIAIAVSEANGKGH